MGVLGKGRKQRFVRVGSGARAAIDAMLAFRPSAAPGEPLWATPEGELLSPHGVQSMLVRLGRRAGVYPCGPHRFRRTFALWCLRDGMDLENLRRIMGHTTLTVLERYLALDVGDVERVHAAHSPVDRILHGNALAGAAPAPAPATGRGADRLAGEG